MTVVSILRLQSLVLFVDSSNPSWDFTGVSDWSAVEINVGIICTCMPTMRLMIVRIFPALGDGTSRNQKYYQSGSLNNAYSKGRSRSGTGGRLPSVVQQPAETKKGLIHQKKTYTVQYDDNDEQSLVPMQDLDSKGAVSKGGF